VTNVFILDFETRMQSWATFRNQLAKLPIDQQCIEVDRYWQRVPLINHYLHPDFMHEWPNPWQLLSDNTYCYYARALGMIYTLLLLGNKDIALVEAKDDNSNEVVLVLVDDAKYVLNYWPETVVNNHITDFVIIKELDISPLLSKLG
jgi:hypothetical protein